MSERKSFWNKGWVIAVGSTVVGALVLRAIDWLADTNILIGVWNFIKSIGGFFNRHYSLPLWVILLIGFSSIILLFLTVYLSDFFSPKKKISALPITPRISEPEWKDYTTDIFEDFRYKWKYKFYNDENKVIITDITAYCPRHNCQVYGSQCVVGKEGLPTYKIDKNEIHILIQHKIDNGLWKK